MSRSDAGAPDDGERIRILSVFLTFLVGAGILFLTLVDLQLVRDHALIAKLRDREHASDKVSGPRGVLLDREGRTISQDRPVFDVRSIVVLRAQPYRKKDQEPWPRTAAEYLPAASRWIDDVVAACSVDEEYASPSQRAALRESLRIRLNKSFRVSTKRLLEKGRDRDGGLRDSLELDIGIDPDVDDPRFLEALESLAHASRHGPREQRPPYRCKFYSKREYSRELIDPELLASVIGRVQTNGKSFGLTQIDLLDPPEDPARTVHLRRSAGGYAVLDRVGEEVPEPSRVWTTLDLELQRIADEELMLGVDRILDIYKAPPEFGGVLLVEIATGDVLAAASYTPTEKGERNPYGGFVPFRAVFPPGSVMKPLHVALGLERGDYDVTKIVNCNDGRFPGRRVPDDHPIGVSDVRRILVQSSNIGAARLGVEMGRDGLQQVVEWYGFDEKSGVQWPDERIGHGPLYKQDNRWSKDLWGKPFSFLDMNDRDFGTWYGPSLSYGYEVNLTLAQLARAYLTMLSGHERHLRLIRGAVVRGQRRPVPIRRGRQVLSGSVRDWMSETLTEVVESGTAKHVRKKIGDREFPAGEMAGKTGTSQVNRRDVLCWDGKKRSGYVRTASFVGFAPARDPKYLAVCVFQKFGAGRFYGGGYAAPTAVGLLLEARKREGVVHEQLDRSGSGGSTAGRKRRGR